MKKNVLNRQKGNFLLFRSMLSMVLIILAVDTAIGALEPSGISLAMFKSGLMTEPTVFKAKIKIASDEYAYNDLALSNGEKEFDVRNTFWAVYVKPFNSRSDASREQVICYVKKESSVGQVIAEALKDGAFHAALVSLRYSKNEKYRRCCVMEDIEMQAAETTSEVTAKFSQTRISVIKGREYHYVQGKIGLAVKTSLKFFKKPVLRVVLLTEENGARVVRDCIIDEPNIKMISSSDSIDNHTTTNGDENNEPYVRRYIEEVSAAQSEVSKEKYGTVTYAGIPLDKQYSRGISGRSREKFVFGYAKFDRDEKAVLLGYRIELWYNGACVSVFDTIKASQLNRLQLPEDWHVSFKYPEKFKYRAPLSNKNVRH